MIKLKTIIRELRANLPFYTDYFSEVVNVDNLSISGSTVTAVTSGDHGFSTGQTISIKDAVNQFEIIDATFLDGVVTIKLNENHDFTEGFDQVAIIQGIDQSEYNGTYDIYTVPSDTEFTYKINATPITPATGTNKLMLYEFSQSVGSYNGNYDITVVDSTTFTYEIQRLPLLDALGNIKAIGKARISGAVSIERAISAYTNQADNNLWGFVVLDGTRASKDRNIATDATNTFSNGADYRICSIVNFSLVVLTPSLNSISGIPERDLMEEIKPALFKSILRVKLENVLSQEAQYSVSYLTDNYITYVDSYLVHQFDFETVVDIQGSDTADYSSVPFRKVDLRFCDPLTKDGDDIILKTDDIILKN